MAWGLVSICKLQWLGQRRTAPAPPSRPRALAHQDMHVHVWGWIVGKGLRVRASVFLVQGLVPRDGEVLVMDFLWGRMCSISWPYR